MAIRRPLNPLTLRISLALLTIAVLATLAVSPLATAAPATPGPDGSVATVQKQLDAMAQQDSRLVEQFDQARIVARQRERAAAAAQQTTAKAVTAYRQMHAQFVLLLQAQYEGDSFGAAGALLDSTSDSNYLERLDLLSMASEHAAELIKADSAARDAARAAAGRARAMLVAAERERDQLAQRRSDVTAQVSRFQQLLTTLNSAQQYTYFESTNPAVTPAEVPKLHLPAASNPRAQRAVTFALAQLGKPYVFGAAGPSTFDCSGLTMRSWQAGGVTLPHSAASQYGYGHHVARRDLQPGDLLFFYAPVDHVTIYVGNGYMVSAPTEGENVSLVPVGAFNNVYAGATRLTG